MLARLLLPIVLAVTVRAHGPSAPAHLHTRLLRSLPALDTTVTTPPSDIRLWFNEPVTVPLTRVTLRVNTTDIPVGTASREGGAEHPVVIPIRQQLGAGRYVVRWTTASADGHPVRGEFRFTVAPSR